MALDTFPATGFECFVSRFTFVGVFVFCVSIEWVGKSIIPSSVRIQNPTWSRIDGPNTIPTIGL